jgi:hypothetical protein
MSITDEVIKSIVIQDFTLFKSLIEKYVTEINFELYKDSTILIRCCQNNLTKFVNELIINFGDLCRP